MRDGRFAGRKGKILESRKTGADNLSNFTILKAGKTTAENLEALFAGDAEKMRKLAAETRRLFLVGADAIFSICRAGFWETVLD